MIAPNQSPYMNPRLAALLEGGSRSAAVPRMVREAAGPQRAAMKFSPRILKMLENVGQFNTPGELPSEPGGIEPGILPGADLPNMDFPDLAAGGLTVSPAGPRIGGRLPPGWEHEQDPEATDYGRPGNFGSVPVEGGFGPFEGFEGTPSLFNTTWSYEPDLGWVPRAIPVGGDRSGSQPAGGGPAGGGSGYGRGGNTFGTHASGFPGQGGGRAGNQNADEKRAAQRRRSLK